jgi:DNA-directed RNA polymerase subunit M/transcription elongation factor TFIIS
MHFCACCDNMYYISITPENELQYYCRNCGHIDDKIASDNICVSKVNMKKTNTTQSFSQVVNKYTKLDPTLPRIKTIRCPNDDCISNKKRSGSSQASSSADDGNSSSKNQENEVIYVRYDDTNLKYIYLCTKCDKVWNTEQH